MNKNISYIGLVWVVQKQDTGFVKTTCSENVPIIEQNGKLHCMRLIENHAHGTRYSDIQWPLPSDSDNVLWIRQLIRSDSDTKQIRSDYNAESDLI